MTEDEKQALAQRLLDRFPPRWFRELDIGDGWLPIVEALDAKLVEIDPDYAILQIKQKFGTLRFYAETTKKTWKPGKEFDISDYQADPFQRAIIEAEKKSAVTCERCGKPGKLRSQRRWILTLCDEDDAKAQADFEANRLGWAAKNGPPSDRN